MTIIAIFYLMLGQDMMFPEPLIIHESKRKLCVILDFLLLVDVLVLILTFVHSMLDQQTKACFCCPRIALDYEMRSSVARFCHQVCLGLAAKTPQDLTTKSRQLGLYRGRASVVKPSLG